MKEQYDLPTNTAWHIVQYAEDAQSWDGDPAVSLKQAVVSVAGMFAGARAGLRPIFEKLIAEGRKLGKDVKVCPCKTIVPFYRNRVFAEVKPATKTRLEFALALGDKKPTGKLQPNPRAKGNDRLKHLFELTTVKGIDTTVLKWLKAAYDADTRLRRGRLVSYSRPSPGGRTRSMASQPHYLRFAWWNLHDFAHYDHTRRSHPRWPRRKADHAAKRDRVLAAFGELFGADYTDLLAVCEITREAAEDLRTRLPPGFHLSISPRYPRDDGFQVAVFFRPAAGLSADVPILSSTDEKREAELTEETRPMLPIHLTIPGHVVRFVACHWTAYDEASSHTGRRRLADSLRRDMYRFLNPDPPRTGTTHHVMILGDLNDEPQSPLFENDLIAHRDRVSSREQHSRSRDEQVSRVWLYNAAWRYLGEQRAHGDATSSIDVAGSYYTKEQGWRTWDHLLVSGGLLGSNPPFLDEAQTRIMSTPLMRDTSGRPTPFDPTAATAPGVSDHLPIVGRIVLPEVTP
jgi:hypothetical protein